MKTVILAGGFGTRLAEYTDKIPKPMVQIGDKPILSHIMNFYQSYGCLLYTSPSPRDAHESRMPSSA